MKKFFATIINGYLGLLFPLIMTVILLEKLHHLLHPLILFIGNHLHISRLLGIMGIVCISVVLMLILGYIAGLLIKSSFIRKEISKFESSVLSKIPVYNLIKSVFGTTINAENSEKFRPALLSEDGESFSLCYVTNESDGFYTIFVSDGGLGGGDLRIVPKKMVKLLDIPLAEFTRLIRQYGINSAHLAEQVKNG